MKLENDKTKCDVYGHVSDGSVYMQDGTSKFKCEECGTYYVGYPLIQRLNLDAIKQ